jgi:exonuclease SbcD
MKIAHLADLHLGYRAYSRTAGGINVRERDVAAAFRYAVDRLLEIRPDCIVVAGDIFETPRPSNTTVAFALQQFYRLSELGVPIVITSGNHDQPKTVESGDPVLLLTGVPNLVYLPHTGALWVWEEGRAEFFAFPFEAQSVSLDFSRNLNRVAIIHGPPPPDDFCAAFDLVLMGHYHIADQPSPNAFYPGSLERASHNVWIEETPKGFMIHDTERLGSPEFIHVPTRPMVDLPRIWNAQKLSPEQLFEEIEARANAVPGGIDGKIVRLVIEDCPSPLLRALPHAKLRELKSRALHFQLAPVRPSVRPKTADELANRKVKTLEQELADFIRDEFVPSSGDIDKEKLVVLAMEYLEKAAETVQVRPEIEIAA